MAVLLGFIHLNIADISHLRNYPSKMRVEEYFIITIKDKKKDWETVSGNTGKDSCGVVSGHITTSFIGCFFSILHILELLAPTLSYVTNIAECDLEDNPKC